MINEIQVGGYNSLLNKLLSMREGSPAPTLAPEIFGAFVLENDRPEWAFLKGERLGIGGQTRTAVVGNRSFVALVNPLGSGALAVVLDVAYSGDQALLERYELRFNNADTTGMTNSNRAINRDLRSIGVPGGNIPMSCQIFGGDLAAPPGVGSVIREGTWGASGTASQNDILIPLDFVLPPGFALLMSANATNTTVSVSWRWRERILDPAELR